MSNVVLLASIVVAMVIISLGLFYADDAPPQPSQKRLKEEEKAMKKAVKKSALAAAASSPTPPSLSSASSGGSRETAAALATAAATANADALSPATSAPAAAVAAGESAWIVSPVVPSPRADRAPASAVVKEPAKAFGSSSSWSPADRMRALEKLDLVASIGGRRLEPVDTFIGLGGKRLRHIRLLGNDPAFDWGRYKRYVWFDLGARVWPKGSTMWFSRNYPKSSSFDAELYDVLDLRHTYPKAPPFRRFAFHSKAAWIRGGTVTIGGVKMGHVKHDGETLDKSRVTVWTTQSVDFAEVLMRNFSAPDDFVVVKMDVEGGEWPLLRHLEKTGALAHIDEMMLECHPPPPDFATSDRKVPLRRGEMHPDCVRLINRMRLSGVHCHGWF